MPEREVDQGAYRGDRPLRGAGRPEQATHDRVEGRLLAAECARKGAQVPLPAFRGQPVGGSLVAVARDLDEPAQLGRQVGQIGELLDGHLGVGHLSDVERGLGAGVGKGVEVAEVPVHGRGRDTCGRRDGLHARGGRGLLGEELDGRADDPLARLLDRRGAVAHLVPSRGHGAPHQ